MEITGWRIVREWKQKYLRGMKLKSHVQRDLVDKTTRNVRHRESGKRLWSRTWSPVSGSVESGRWKVCWVSRRRLAQFAKWCLNRAVVSVKKEQIYSLVQLKKLPWGGLQWAAMFLPNFFC